jgi:hypothetical protein
MGYKESLRYKTPQQLHASVKLKRARREGSRRTKIAIRRLSKQEFTEAQILEHLRQNRMAVKLGISLGAFLSVEE